MRPNNTAALAGSTVQFRCKSRNSNQTRWDYYKHGVNQPSTIFNGERVDWRVSSRFTVNASNCMKHRCDLVIRDVRTQDAGHFVCFEPSSSNRLAAALVVLGNYSVKEVMFSSQLVCLLAGLRKNHSTQPIFEKVVGKTAHGRNH